MTVKTNKKEVRTDDAELDLTMKEVYEAYNLVQSS